MPLKKVFIIVPAAVNTSPIKGAAALANSLSQFVSVTFIALRPGSREVDFLNKSIDRVLFTGKESWYMKLVTLRQLIKDDVSKDYVATISFGLSADFFNGLCTNLAVTCASVRGNLPIVYVNTYGFIGRLIAYFHLKWLKRMTHVVSMTNTMSMQVQKYIGHRSPVIGNFIDESRLVIYRKKYYSEKKYRFVFIGSLIKGKQVLLLLDAIASLVKNNTDVRLDVLGGGPLLHDLKNRSIQLGIVDKVVFYGHIEEPYDYLSNSDVFVLPSISEGISRAALEALFLGIPCVLRDVDGASELIQEKVNGCLFKDDSELADAMIRAVELSHSRSERKSLLPDKFRQQNAAKQYLSLLESSA